MMGLFGKKKPIDVSKEKIDYSGIFSSMAHGQELFNKLKVKCHPDRFVGTDKESVAQELFKLVQENSTDYKKLLELQERIEKEL